MATDVNAAHSLRTVEFKGRMTTLNVIRIQSSDLPDVDQAISEKVGQASEFFSNLPVLLELDPSSSLAPADLMAMVERNRLALIGMIGCCEALDQQARAAGMVVFPANAFGADRPAPRQAQTAPDESCATAEVGASAEPSLSKAHASTEGKTPTVLVKHPVRSGQQIYARGGDLIVLAAVGEGAEVLADGHIHIYGPLRGRALAGVQGDTQARIFCKSLQAELVSVAGSYCISEDISPRLQGKSVQISLGSNEVLSIDLL